MDIAGSVIAAPATQVPPMQSEEQKARIEANRLRALERLRAKGHQRTPAEVISATKSVETRKKDIGNGHDSPRTATLVSQPSEVKSGAQDELVSRGGFINDDMGGGGFLVDDGDEEEEVSGIGAGETREGSDPSGAALSGSDLKGKDEPISDQAPASSSCQHCSTLTVIGDLLSTFKEAVCYECRPKYSEFDLLIKTRAKEEYLLSDKALEGLPFLEKVNPNKTNWTPMKLYLRKLVERMALAKYGSLEELEKEKEKRKQEKWKRSSKRNKDLLKKQTSGSSVVKKRSVRLAFEDDHTHTYIEEFAQASQTWYNVCECGMRVPFEKF